MPFDQTTGIDIYGQGCVMLIITLSVHCVVEKEEERPNSIVVKVLLHCSVINMSVGKVQALVKF